LHREAPWFAEERLREAAIVETLTHWSGLGEDVASRAAQDTWRRVWQGQRRQPPAGLLADDEQPSAKHDDWLRGWVEEQHSAGALWLAAWERWASSQGP
jgi:hypothetical protein